MVRWGGGWAGGGRDSEAITAAAAATAARGGEHGELREIRVTELTITSANEEAVVSGGDQGIRGGLFKFIDELNNPNHHNTNALNAALPLGLVLLRVNEVRAASDFLAPLSQSLSETECGQPYISEASSAPARISTAAESSRGSSRAFYRPHIVPRPHALIVRARAGESAHACWRGARVSYRLGSCLCGSCSRQA
jgi:hypothetical protein